MNWWIVLLLGSLGALTSLPLRAAEMEAVADYPAPGGGWGRGSASSGVTQPSWPPAHQTPWPPQEHARPPVGDSGSSSSSSGGDRPNPLDPYPNRGGTTVYPWRYYPRSGHPPNKGSAVCLNWQPELGWRTCYPRSGHPPNKGYPPTWESPQSPNGVNDYPFWK